MGLQGILPSNPREVLTHRMGRPKIRLRMGCKASLLGTFFGFRPCKNPLKVFPLTDNEGCLLFFYMNML